MKKFVILVVCLIFSITFVYASDSVGFSSLCDISCDDVVRIAIRSGSSGRTEVIIESREIIEDIYSELEQGRFVPVDKDSEGGRGGWQYNIKIYTDIFDDSAFEYTLNTGTSCIDGVWYELKDWVSLLETVEKYMKDPFSYEGIMVGSGTPPADQEIIIKPWKKTAVAYGMEVEMDVPAIIKDDRLFVPLRFVSETLGATVIWNGDDKTVFIKNGVTELLMSADNTEVIVNGRLFNVDVPPFISEDRMYVPIRFIAEFTGNEVQWLSGRGEAVITRIF